MDQREEKENQQNRRQANERKSKLFSDLVLPIGQWPVLKGKQEK